VKKDELKTHLAGSSDIRSAAAAAAAAATRFPSGLPIYRLTTLA